MVLLMKNTERVYLNPDADDRNLYYSADEINNPGDYAYVMGPLRNDPDMAMVMLLEGDWKWEDTPEHLIPEPDLVVDTRTGYWEYDSFPVPFASLMTEAEYEEYLDNE